MSASSAIRNIQLLLVIRALRAALIPIAVIVPFFQANGLSQTEIFITQSAFAAAVLVLEVPSGYFADRYGRKLSLLIGAILWAVGSLGYYLSYGFGPIIPAELVLGVAVSFISGADSALAYDSLASIKRRDQYRAFEARSMGYTGVAEAAGSIAGGLIALLSVRATWLVQFALAVPAIVVCLKLWEPPRQIADSHRDVIRDVGRITKYALHGHQEIKWLIIYGAVVGTSTHTMVWLIQPYFQAVGINIGLFGVLWAVLMISMALFSRWAIRYEESLGKGRALASFVIIGAVSYIGLGLGMAIWALPLLFGFYFIRAVKNPILKDYINALIDSDVRATVLSVQSLAQRVVYIGAGPLIGYVMDLYSLSTALLFSGALYGTLGGLTLLMMRRHRLL